MSGEHYLIGKEAKFLFTQLPDKVALWIVPGSKLNKKSFWAKRVNDEVIQFYKSEIVGDKGILIDYNRKLVKELTGAFAEWYRGFPIPSTYEVADIKDKSEDTIPKDAPECFGCMLIRSESIFKFPFEFFSQYDELHNYLTFYRHKFINIKPYGVRAFFLSVMTEEKQYLWLGCGSVIRDKYHSHLRDEIRSYFGGVIILFPGCLVPNDNEKVRQICGPSFFYPSKPYKVKRIREERPSLALSKLCQILGCSEKEIKRWD